MTKFCSHHACLHHGNLHPHSSRVTTLVKDDAKPRLLISVRNPTSSVALHMRVSGFWNRYRLHLATRCGWGPFPIFFFPWIWLCVRSLSLRLLWLWILLAIHFTTKQVETNWHGNFLEWNWFDLGDDWTHMIFCPPDDPVSSRILIDHVVQASSLTSQWLYL